jgi:DNA invertase Pin-like site-specific DNA recombinase
MSECGIYARVSTAEQVKGYSIEAQLDPCRAYAASNGWSIYAEYIDPGHTGRTDQRPGFQSAIRDALAGKFTHLLVHKFDRFARNRLHAVTYKALLRDKGIEVISISQPIDRESAIGNLLEGVTEVFDEWFSINLRTETLKGQWKALDQGKWPNRAPWGYYKNNDSVLVADVGAWIAMAFREFSTGNYTLTSWADTAYDLGITRNDKKIPFTAWSYIFSNRFYVGIMTWAGKEATGRHEPLVDQETFDKVQAILKANHNNSVNRRVYRDYLLGGLLWSNDANSPMIGTMAKEKFAYYRSKKSTPDGKRHYVLADILERQIPIMLQGVSVNPNDLDSLTELDDGLRLAMKVSPSIGVIYQWLKSDEQRRAILNLVVDNYGLKVSGDEIMSLTTRTPFCFSVDLCEALKLRFDQKLVPPNRVEPFYYYTLENHPLTLNSILFLGVLA